MLNIQLHPSTDIITKGNVQWKKEKGTVIMKEIQPKSILWVQAGDFNATKKIWIMCYRNVNMTFH